MLIENIVFYINNKTIKKYFLKMPQNITKKAHVSSEAYC